MLCTIDIIQSLYTLFRKTEELLYNHAQVHVHVQLHAHIHVHACKLAAATRSTASPDARREADSRGDPATAMVKLNMAIHLHTVLQKRGHAPFKVEAATYDITDVNGESI